MESSGMEVGFCVPSRREWKGFMLTVYILLIILISRFEGAGGGGKINGEF